MSLKIFFTILKKLLLLRKIETFGIFSIFLYISNRVGVKLVHLANIKKVPYGKMEMENSLAAHCPKNILGYLAHCGIFDPLWAVPILTLFYQSAKSPSQPKECPGKSGSFQKSAGEECRNCVPVFARNLCSWFLFSRHFIFSRAFLACCLLDTAGFQPLTQENTSVRYCAFLAYIYYIEYCMNSRR